MSEAKHEPGKTVIRPAPAKDSSTEPVDEVSEVSQESTGVWFSEFTQHPKQMSGEDSEDENAPTLPEISGYEVLERLGRGGMGVVYRARDLTLKRDVAIKIMAPGVDHPELLSRFETEAQAVAQLQHPHVVRIYDVREHQGAPCFVMEYIDGGSLDQQINGQPQNPEVSARLVEVLARAVEACHSSGVIHRDLKPANVLVTSQGQPKVTDFGLAKWLTAEARQHETKPGEILGTPAYMPPEQASGVVKNITGQCDVYSLGAILYELLTGRPPFQGPDPLQIVMQVLANEPVPVRQLQPTVPVDLETICLKCLSKETHRRYATAEELADDLQRFLNGEPILARPVGTVERFRKWARRHPARAGLIIVSCVALLVITIGSTIYNQQLRQRNEELNAEIARADELFSGGHTLARWLLFDHTREISHLKGSATARRDLVTRILSYLDGITAQIRADQTVNEQITASDLALGYEQVAGVLGDPYSSNLGETEAARTNLEKALALREQIVQANPQDLTSRLNYWICRAKLADLDMVTGNRQQVERSYAEVISGLKKLHEEYPDRASVVESYSLTFSRLADFKLEQGDALGAIQNYSQAFVLFRDKFGEQPDDVKLLRRLSYLHSRLGAAYEKQGQNPAARGHYRQMFELVEGIRMTRLQDAKLQQDLTTALIHFGDLATREESYPQATTRYERAVRLRREMSVLDPENASVQRNLQVALERLATNHELQQQFTEAVPIYEEALDIVQRLAVGDPQNIFTRRDLWILEEKTGSCLLKLNHLDRAKVHLERAQIICQELLQSGKGGAKELQGLGQIYQSLAQLEFSLMTEHSSLEEMIRQSHRARDWLLKGETAFVDLEERQPLDADQQKLRNANTILLQRVQTAINQFEALPTEPTHPLETPKENT